MSFTLELLKQGREALQQQHQSLETQKLYTLRIGNSGMYSEGKWYGQCPRRVIARYYGIQTEDTSGHRDSKFLMFDGGYTNEDSWVQLLTKAWRGNVLRETECEVNTYIQSAEAPVPLSGRPDILLTDKLNQPVVGFELKQVSSIWTARSVLVQGVPKLSHLCQALNYQILLKAPAYELWYTARTKYPNFKFFGKLLFETEGETAVPAHLLQHCEFNDKGSIKALHPFMSGYKMELVDGKLVVTQMTRDFVGEPQPTIITLEGIQDFWGEIVKCIKSDRLPEAPESVDVFGNRLSYKSCDYCDAACQAACQADPKELGDWLTHLNRA